MWRLWSEIWERADVVDGSHSVETVFLFLGVKEIRNRLCRYELAKNYLWRTLRMVLLLP
jgi:hypothetical protein